MAYLYLTGVKGCHFLVCYGSAQQGMDSWSTEVVGKRGVWGQGSTHQVGGAWLAGVCTGAIACFLLF
jgi:hypothetical protein